MSSAQNHVLSTPELLEAILARLPPVDLLLVQRISRDVSSLITSSPILQQKLFFRPVPPKPSGEWTLNSLLRNKLLPWFVSTDDRWCMPSYDTLEHLDWARDLKARDAFLCKDASWRKMFPVQPPPQSLRIVEIRTGQRGKYVREAMIPFSTGVTMDVLYDIPWEYLTSERASEFSLQINGCPG
ncbi:hypothetical protein CC78DRAFT_582472 [Lojkania enalia]|uniref:F-box domain-containing protein n=1 Tax=Lojkania enalia TaxID=147567 RepID=A0A9P4N2F6_9PLEO|nr:hypothetical protein CC78DRAFT_582472 [Didymosphaeria enalia]